MRNNSLFYNTIIPRLDSVLAIDKSFDLIHRKLAIGGRDATIYFIDGFVKDEVLQKMIQQFFSQQAQQVNWFLKQQAWKSKNT